MCCRLADYVRPCLVTPARWPVQFAVIALLFTVLTILGSVRADENDVLPEGVERLFEAEVRPVLMEQCSGCHGDKKQEGGLRVDSRQALLGGGQSGAAIVPGDRNSLLLKAIRRDGDLAMPPDEHLSRREVEVLQRWVLLGAVWPAEKLSASSRMPTAVEAAKNHWAFQPVRRPEIPRMADTDWVRSPVDAFIAAKLQASQLQPSPRADRRTLIRRASYALTGLPPTGDDVQAFVNDTDPGAYEKLIDRLLESPHYGEHWGRHWLDVARYSDTKGYVYAREERFWTHAWTYRDWVVRSLNNDMPYDRFLLLQLAADQIGDCTKDDLAAMGFLTLGRRFLGVRRDIIDDRIDTVCRGTMGLTVSCARCHDHKYDPIPTADYYSLYGVFDSCVEQQNVLAEAAGDDAFRAELQKRQKELHEKLQQLSDESSRRCRERAGDYLFAQTELHKYPADGFDQVFQKTDLLPMFVRRWENYLHAAKLRHDPVFAYWHAYMELDAATFATDAASVTARLQAAGAASNARVVAAFAIPPTTLREVCDRYAQLFNNAAAATGNDDSAVVALQRVVLDADGPCRVPAGPISHNEMYFDTDTLTELWKLQGEVDRWLNGAVAVPVAMTLVDQQTPAEPRVFRRGNPLQLGADVPRQFLQLLSSEDRRPFQHGSGRLELARAIIDPTNPLTARVIVNRVWAHHFGQGLVVTPSDFGLRADPPSHPELLDWLAAEFIRDGWSIKQLHRWIMLSSTYQQSSQAVEDRQRSSRLAQVDPNNRWMWRMSPRRMTFEELRDSMLLVCGELNLACGGKPANLLEQPFPTRRTLYGLLDRQYFPSTLRFFDVANPDLHIPQRIETTVPQQALFFINHPFVLERARSLAKVARSGDDPGDAIQQMFRSVYQRTATAEESTEALAFVAGIGASGPLPVVASTAAVLERDTTSATAESEPTVTATTTPLDAWEQLAQILLCANEFLFID